MVIAVVMPIRLMAKQRKLVYDNKDHIGKVNAAKEARDIAPKKGYGHADSLDRYGRGLNASAC